MEEQTIQAVCLDRSADHFDFESGVMLLDVNPFAPPPTLSRLFRITMERRGRSSALQLFRCLARFWKNRSMHGMMKASDGRKGKRGCKLLFPTRVGHF